MADKVIKLSDHRPDQEQITNTTLLLGMAIRNIQEAHTRLDRIQTKDMTQIMSQLVEIHGKLFDLYDKQ